MRTEQESSLNYTNHFLSKILLVVFLHTKEDVSLVNIETSSFLYIKCKYLVNKE